MRIAFSWMMVTLVLATAGISWGGDNLLSTNADSWKAAGAGRIQPGAGNVATVHISRVGAAGTPVQASQTTAVASNSFYQLSGRVHAIETSRIKASLLARTQKNGWLFQWEAPQLSSPVDAGQTREFNIRAYMPESAATIETILQVVSGSAEFSDLSLMKVDAQSAPLPDAPKLEFWINMDFNDNVVYAHNLGLTTYGEREIVAFFEHCKKAGVTGVQWRVSLFGQMLYRSKGAATVFPGSMPLDKLSSQEREVAHVMADIDPLAIAVREARKRGIRLYIWMTLSDEGYVHDDIAHYCMPQFLIDNPAAALMDRSGKSNPGTLCYSEPAAREYRLNIVRELLDYDADGLYLCTRTHSTVFGTDTGDDYGFNPAIVAEYKKRYGIDILTQDFDVDKWRAIKAEGVDALLHDIGQLAHARGQKVRLGVAASTLANDAFFGNWGKTPVDWRKYLKEGWIDSILDGQNKVEPFFASREINLFRQVARADQTFYFWAQMVDYAGDRLFTPKELIEQAEFFRILGANGGVYHEALNMEENMSAYLFPIGDYYGR